jgi:hypothetical protein
MQRLFLTEYQTCREVAQCLKLLERRMAELAVYQEATVYSNARGFFDPDNNIVFLVYSLQGRTCTYARVSTSARP